MAEEPRLTLVGRLFVFIFIAGCAAGAYFLFSKKPLFVSRPSAAANSASPGAGASSTDGKSVRIGVAYGTEKQRWLAWAVEQFAATKEGQQITIDLIPLGSVEGAQALLAGDQRIQAWSPASSIYKDVFLQEWNLKYGKSPILHEESLALTPMVFVMWAERADAFSKKYAEVSFETIGAALADSSGWEGLAHRPEWGVFKFGHTHPNQSNSGLATLLLMAYDFHKKSRNLALADILDPKFQAWMIGIEKGANWNSNSTGNLMKDMVLRGPSSYDALCVYESVAIDYLRNAEGRWGALRVSYPRQNFWNDNPYYVLDVPWSTPRQRDAARAFSDFLMTEPIQRESLKHGFRPGNPAVPIKGPDSPWTQLASSGLRIDIASTSETPSAEVINNLLAIWQRSAR